MIVFEHSYLPSRTTRSFSLFGRRDDHVYDTYLTTTLIWFTVRGSLFLRALCYRTLLLNLFLVATFFTLSSDFVAFTFSIFHHSTELSSFFVFTSGRFQMCY